MPLYGVFFHSSASLLLSPTLLWPLEKLIEGLKSPETSSLMLPDLLSLSDPFSGSVEESAKGEYVSRFPCCGLQLNVIGCLDGTVFPVCSVDFSYLQTRHKQSEDKK